MTGNALKHSLIIIALILFNNINAQLSIYEVPLSKQVYQSSHIAEGKVVSITPFWNNSETKIFTAYTIEVSKVFKGLSNAFIDVIVEGGVIGLDAQIVSHSLNLRTGELGLFLLSDMNNMLINLNNNIPRYKMVSDVQGFYKYSIEEDKVVNNFSLRYGIESNFYKEIKGFTGLPEKEIQSYKHNTSYNQNNLRSETNTAISLTTLTTSDNSAGTKSVLTINGAGFGTAKGSVEFSNANYGGYIFFAALENQILNWSDTKIEVEIPYLAGTGKIKINTISNGTIESDEDLPIDFAQINLESNLGSGVEAFQTQLIDLNDSGGYTWVMNSDFSNNQNAVDAFMRAFDNWTCSSGVNWSIDIENTTASNSAMQDGNNVITFDNTLASGVLGRSTSYYQGCVEGSVIKWYVVEIDIVFNPNKAWNYSTDLPLSNEIDFESITLHELGHAHQLGHVVDTNEIMHYSLLNGVSKRELSNKDLTGAIDIHQRSIDSPVCSMDAMTNSVCFQANLSNNDLEILSKGIKAFPNPSNGQVFLKNSSHIAINKIEVYNILGALVQSYNNIGLYNDIFKLIIPNRGLFLIKMEADNAIISKKIIVQ